MAFTTLYILPCLLAAVTFTECVKLTVSPSITAECGQPVTLHCHVVSSRKGLSIKYMEWFQNKTYCSVDSEGDLTKYGPHSDFQCDYQRGHLSLRLPKVQPLQNETPFRCKLHSNQGILHRHTSVDLKECCGNIEAVWTPEGPSCTFKEVFPDGDVDWFHGSHKLTDSSLIYTTKKVEAGGWLTIHSSLDTQRTTVLYNCSLKSTASGRYIASSLIQQNTQLKIRSRGAAQGPFLTFLWICGVLAVEKHTY